MKTREQALREAGLVIADAVAIFMRLSPEDAAKRAWTPDGPPLYELTAHIAAIRERRAGR